MGRLRNRPDAINLITNFTNCINFDDISLKNFNEIHLEIGSGKGDFLISKSLSNSKILFIGVEKYATIVLKALNKLINKPIIKNLYFICSDVNKIPLLKFNNSIAKIYLNFPDPWPKKRHVNKRLTSPIFLNLYKKILIDEGEIEFKTDNKNLYSWTIDQLKSRNDINIIYKTENLYANNKNVNLNNTQTEYEKKFLILGKHICKIIFKFA